MSIEYRALFSALTPEQWARISRESSEHDPYIGTVGGDVSCIIRGGDRTRKVRIAPDGSVVVRYVYTGGTPLWQFQEPESGDAQGVGVSDPIVSGALGDRQHLSLMGARKSSALMLEGMRLDGTTLRVLIPRKDGTLIECSISPEGKSSGIPFP